MPNNVKVLIVGAGNIGTEYCRIIHDLGLKPVVVGRSKEKIDSIRHSYPIEAYSGGIEHFFENNVEIFSHAIVAVNVQYLFSTTKLLIEHRVKNILVEKPAGLNIEEISALSALSTEYDCNVFVAYNRRFYASTKEAIKIINEDGGVQSFHFEFTEWAFKIEPLPYPSEVKEGWLLANSSHVIDLAFFLGGEVKEIRSFSAGGLSWHTKGSIYSGAGQTETGALFSYQANWQAPGRWSLEVLTGKHRLIFRPLEKLFIQKIGSLDIEEVNIDDVWDTRYKPGFYNQVLAFIEGKDKSKLLSIHEQMKHMAWYDSIETGNK